MWIMDTGTGTQSTNPVTVYRLHTNLVLLYVEPYYISWRCSYTRWRTFTLCLLNVEAMLMISSYKVYIANKLGYLTPLL